MSKFKHFRLEQKRQIPRGAQVAGHATQLAKRPSGAATLSEVRRDSVLRRRPARSEINPEDRPATSAEKA